MSCSRISLQLLGTCINDRVGFTDLPCKYGAENSRTAATGVGLEDWNKRGNLTVSCKWRDHDLNLHVRGRYV